jgi:photosystem II stability/assembly factor-like uncharacterized protein
MIKTFITHSVIMILALSWVGTPESRAQINEWTSLPWPEGGAVQRLLIDSQNPNTLYSTGSVYALHFGVGIFKSTNGGGSWRAINFGLADTAVSSLAIAPQDPRILYAGTLSGGVFKSIDGGESWGTTGLTNNDVIALMTNNSINALAIDPQNPRTVYAATGAGLYKSIDAGITWMRLAPDYLPPVQLLAIDPRRPGIIYAGEGGCCSDGALFKSADGGVHWTEIPAMSGCLMNAMLFPQQRSDTVYAAAGCMTGEVINPYIFKSVDGGTSWSTLNLALPEMRLISALAINPQNPDTLYVGTPDHGVFKTIDGGVTWQAVDPNLRPPGVNALVIDPQNPNQIYLGTGAGVLKSTDAGSSWNFDNTGLHANGVTALALDPLDSSTLYAAAEGEWLFNPFTDQVQGAFGISKSTDRGTTWKSVNPVNAVTTGLTVAPDRTVYACTTQALYKSSDSGASWTSVSAFPTGDCVSLVIDSQNATTLYVGTGLGVFKSIDVGKSWRSASSGLPTIFNRPVGILRMAVDPTPAGTIYAVTDSFAGDPPISYGLFKSTDGAISWNRVSSLPTESFFRSLAISPQMPSAMYAATSTGLFKSTDGGLSWISVNFGMDGGSVFTLAVDPQDPATLYAGTSRGLFTITFGTQGPVTVDNFQFNQASVRIGDSFVARASGANLTAQTYLDVLYRAPGSIVVEEALNWQIGAAGVHTIPAGTQLGTWIVSGVRAHVGETDHTGAYVPVSTTVNVVLADGTYVINH